MSAFPSANSSQSTALALTGLILTSFFWAGNAIAAKLSSHLIDPVSLAFWRWAIPFTLFLPLTLRYLIRYQVEIKRQLWHLVILSFLSITCYNSLLYSAAHFTTAINITLVNTALPVGTILFSMMLLPWRPSATEITGAGISLLGTLIILSGGALSALFALKFNPGDLIMGAAVACWSLYSVLLKKWQPELPPFALFCVQVSIGLFLLLPFFLFSNTTSSKIPDLSGDIIWILAYVGIFPSAAAYILWNFGIRQVGPGIASIFSYLIPVFTALLANMVLNETLYWHHIFGGIATLAGLVLSSWSQFNPHRKGSRF
ncbi:MAG: DMT family transporter [Pseudomonadales bacterium]|nr:DMT family transporter [Pseudomonadales bacterium]